MIATLTGPSGVGKTTLLNNLVRSLGARSLESVTTRPARPTDEPSFVYASEAEFEAMRARGEFVWTVAPHGYQYGTRKAAVDEALASLELYLPVLTIEAVQILHEYAPHKIISLYLTIDNEAELRRRFRERADMSEEEVESRINECRSWSAQAKSSGMPFIYIDGSLSREEVLKKALTALESARMHL